MKLEEMVECAESQTLAHIVRSQYNQLENNHFKNGPQSFNSIPKNIRNMTRCGIEDFKMKLDKFLEIVPDEPSVRGLVPRACTADARPSNSILDQVKMVKKRSHGR